MRADAHVICGCGRTSGSENRCFRGRERHYDLARGLQKEGCAVDRHCSDSCRRAIVAAPVATHTLLCFACLFLGGVRAVRACPCLRDVRRRAANFSCFPLPLVFSTFERFLACKSAARWGGGRGLGVEAVSASSRETRSRRRAVLVDFVLSVGRSVHPTKTHAGGAADAVVGRPWPTCGPRGVGVPRVGGSPGGRRDLQCDRD